MQGTYKRNIEARSRNHFCRGKYVILITYTEDKNITPRMRRVILSCVA